MNEKLLLTLIDKFSAGNAAELDFDDGTARLILRKEGAFTRYPPLCSALAGSGMDIVPDAGAAGSGGAVHLGFPVNAVSVPQGGAGPGSGGQEGSGAPSIVTSPIVATFYAASGPDTPPFVRPGAKVKSGDTLCILEAMKMMNRLEAEFDCEILAIKAVNGELVEYGQALFEVKRL
jgi:acetyl-CoA carboxylase biotin carboxyl carrier protein